MVQRTVNRALIVHNDIAIGVGAVVQTRGDTTAAEQKIELDWIFRTAAEIRALDYSKYTRVSLHTEGPLVHYAWDATSNAVDDAWNVLTPLTNPTLGRWVRTGALPKVFAYDTTSLEDVTHEVNTMAFKETGFQVFNTTTSKPVWAAGSADADVWVESDGTTEHTPV